MLCEISQHMHVLKPCSLLTCRLPMSWPAFRQNSQPGLDALMLSLATLCFGVALS